MQEKMFHGEGYIHSGKVDYDDCFDVGSNATKKRTIRRQKKKYNREIDKYIEDSSSTKEIYDINP